MITRTVYQGQWSQGQCIKGQWPQGQCIKVHDHKDSASRSMITRTVYQGSMITRRVHQGQWSQGQCIKDQWSQGQCIKVNDHKDSVSRVNDHKDCVSRVNDHKDSVLRSMITRTVYQGSMTTRAMYQGQWPQGQCIKVNHHNFCVCVRDGLHTLTNQTAKVGSRPHYCYNWLLLNLTKSNFKLTTVKITLGLLTTTVHYTGLQVYW